MDEWREFQRQLSRDDLPYDYCPPVLCARLPGEGGRVMTASRGPRIGRKARERERQAEKARQRLANFTPEQKERHLQRRREWRRASLTPQSVSSI